MKEMAFFVYFWGFILFLVILGALTKYLYLAFYLYFFFFVILVLQLILFQFFVKCVFVQFLFCLNLLYSILLVLLQFLIVLANNSSTGVACMLFSECIAVMIYKIF